MSEISTKASFQIQDSRKQKGTKLLQRKTVRLLEQGLKTMDLSSKYTMKNCPRTLPIKTSKLNFLDMQSFLAPGTSLRQFYESQQVECAKDARSMYLFYWKCSRFFMMKDKLGKGGMGEIIYSVILFIH